MSRVYQPWTDAEVDRMREMAEQGMTAPDIAARMPGRTLSQLRNKLQSEGIRTVHPLQRRGRDPVQEWESRRDAAKRDVERIEKAYAWLKPIQLPAPPRQKIKSTPAPFTLVAGDFHFGMSDPRVCNVILATVEALKPKRVILNGDTVDLLAVSRYPKDKRRGKTWELRDEVTAFHEFLHTLHSIGDGWGIEVVETEANHSGDGTAGRWWRYLNDRCPELLGHAEAEERLSYASWFFPKWSNIRLVDSVMVADELLVMHGDMVRSHAAYTAKASREKWMNSVLVNHTHRMGFSPKTIAAHAGRPASYVRAYENGCACVLEVPYGVALDWQQGFSLVCEDKDAFGIEQVMVDNGRANVAALGKTLRA